MALALQECDKEVAGVQAALHAAQAESAEMRAALQVCVWEQWGRGREMDGWMRERQCGRRRSRAHAHAPASALLRLLPHVPHSRIRAIALPPPPLFHHHHPLPHPVGLPRFCAGRRPEAARGRGPRRRLHQRGAAAEGGHARPAAGQGGAPGEAQGVRARGGPRAHVGSPPPPARGVGAAKWWRAVPRSPQPLSGHCGRPHVSCPSRHAHTLCAMPWVAVCNHLPVL